MEGQKIDPELFSILSEIMDPEVPVLSIIELGVLRSARLDGRAVKVVITPTYSGCPALQVMSDSIKEALETNGYGPIDIEVVYAPAWTTDWLPEVARQKLKQYGIAPPGAVDDDTPLVQISSQPKIIPCPWCNSQNTKTTSQFGSTACKSLHYCNACQQPFEHFKAF